MLIFLLLGCSSKRAVESNFSTAQKEQYRQIELLLLQIQSNQKTNSITQTDLKEKIKIYDLSKADSCGNYPVMMEIDRITNQTEQTEDNITTNISAKDSANIDDYGQTEASGSTQETQKNCRSPAYIVVVLILIILINALQPRYIP